MNSWPNSFGLSSLRRRQLKPRAQAALGRVRQRDGPTVNLGKVTHDRQTKTGARRGFVGAHSSLKDYIAHLRWNAWSIVINENDDAAAFPKRLHADRRLGPFTCVVEQIAQHLIQAFALDSSRVLRRNLHLDIKAAG